MPSKSPDKKELMFSKKVKIEKEIDEEMPKGKKFPFRGKKSSCQAEAMKKMVKK